MTEAKPKAKVTIRTILSLIIGIAAFIIYARVFNLNIPEIISTVQNAYLSIFLIAIIFSIGDVFISAISWRAILSSLKVKVSIVRAFLYTFYSIFIDTLIPTEGISGTVLRIYLVNKDQNGTNGITAASIVTQGLITTAINVIMLNLGVAFLFNTILLIPILFNLIILFTIATTFVIVLILLISWNEKWSLKIINDLVNLGNYLSRARWKQRLSKLREEMLDAAKLYNDSMEEFRHNPTSLILPVLLLIINWLTSFSVPYFVFLSLGLNVPWAIISTTSSIVTTIRMITIGIPFEAGIPEITMITFYTWIGIPAEISAAATILIRILTLWLRFSIGLIAQLIVEFRR